MLAPRLTALITFPFLAMCRPYRRSLRVCSSFRVAVPLQGPEFPSSFVPCAALRLLEAADDARQPHRGVSVRAEVGAAHRDGNRLVREGGVTKG